PALTRTGSLLGTPYYMAPELWEGKAATEQSDIYSLGALLYELCAGTPPHRAKSVRELLRAVQKKEIQPLRERVRGVDKRLSDIVDLCLRKNPQERFASADALCEALEQLIDQEQPPAATVRPAPEERISLTAGQRALCLVRGSELAAVLKLLDS